MEIFTILYLMAVICLLVAVKIYFFHLMVACRWNWRSTFAKGISGIFLDGSDLFLLDQGGVSFSSDNGMTWTNKKDGLDPQISVFDMIRFENLLFLGGQVQPIYPNTTDPYGALYKSTDNGESWQWCDVPFAENDIAIRSFLSVDTILIALGQKAVYRSADRGSSWQNVLNSESYYSPILSVDSVIIVGGDSAIFRSLDYGATWQVVEDTTGATSFIKYNGAILAATGKINKGILRSDDLGESWYSLPFYSGGDIKMAELYQSGAYLFGMDSFDGLFRSDDDGMTWENISRDFPVPISLRSFIIKDSLLLLSNLNTGILRSADYGSTWEEADNGLINIPMYSLYAEDNLLLASNAYPSSSWGMLFESMDKGSTWDITSSDIPNYKKCFLRLNDNLYAGTLWGGVVASTDDGASWMAKGIPGGSVNSLVEINDSIYAGIDGINWLPDKGIYVTGDQGDTWSAANNGLPDGVSVAKIIVVPESVEHGKIIFIATNQGVFYSRDNGNNWLPANNGFGNRNIWTIAVTFASTRSGFNLFAASYDHLFISDDLGENWIPSNSINYESSLKLFSYTEMQGLDSVLFALADTKIFVSSDQGKNWKSIGDGIEQTHFYDIDINSKYLYAGTSRGVWKRSLSEIVPDSLFSNIEPIRYELEQNYPNPFNAATKIKYSIPQLSNVVIRIYDILGSEIETLVNVEKTAGIYELNWNAANLPSGVYIYQIKAGSFIQSKKMILLK